MKDQQLKDFILVGGTALSLQIGHRLSIDIDLFTTKGFDDKAMLNHLQNQYPIKVREKQRNTMMINIGNVKVDILAHKYDWQKPIETKDGVRLASLQDIGAMKLHVIFQSGTRIKDFVDMYFLLEYHPLKIYLEAYENKYAGNTALAAYSLTYFDNIIKEFGVSMIKGKENSWEKMTGRLKEAVLNPNKEFGKQEETKNIPKRKGRGFGR